jgi:hypothetical protein
MKSIISSNSLKEAKTVWTAYVEWVKKNGNFFKEKKKESKLNHGIEKVTLAPEKSPNKLQGEILKQN